MTERLENALSRSEQAAKSVSLAAGRLAQAAKRLGKASANGELTQLREARARLLEAAEEALRSATEAGDGWPWSESEEEELLRSGYMAEVEAAAADMDIVFHRYGDQSGSSYPVLVRVEPKTKSVRLDRRRVRALRPSVLLRQIQQIRQLKPRQTPEQFIEILYSGYLTVLGRKALVSGVVRQGKSVLLVDVHKALTLFPDARKEYPLDEFSRDIHQLNASGLRNTKSGQVLGLSASTGTKSGTGVLTIVDDNAHPFYYFSATFRKGEQP